tara:strand:- start:3655 stop:4233 length:579 start_codon:yes stop_codon:yes gene_type:complete
MPISINGSGTVTGLAVGGLPDGTVDADTLASGAGGKLLQVVQTLKSDTASTTSTSFTDISGTSVSITPSSSSNKVLVIAFLGQFVQASDVLYIALTTGDGTGIIQGDTVSGKESVATAAYHGGNSQGEAYFGANPATIVVLHSPNTTSAVTYKLRWRVNNSGSNAYLNRNVNDGSQYAIRTATTLTAMEISS